MSGQPPKPPPKKYYGPLVHQYMGTCAECGEPVTRAEMTHCNKCKALLHKKCETTHYNTTHSSSSSETKNNQEDRLTIALLITAAISGAIVIFGVKPDNLFQGLMAFLLIGVVVFIFVGNAMKPSD